MAARAATGEESSTGPHFAAVASVRSVSRTSRGTGDDARKQLRAACPTPFIGSPLAGSAGQRFQCGIVVASGATPINRSAPPTTAENTGAATSPP